ncbi:MAG: DNA-directed RNA polymerase subunit alpha [Anaerolineae bacterium]|nr:DNA-directed RNA polymerase subunit alpha [Anaerolineae bacterium]MDX9831701.1 DNA-directed RNA polymerase subunit alpha [Anaerolineae bacterium]
MPKIESDAQARNYGRFIIGPMESGYGTTVGNALRRILLSSLEGAAITSVQVRGIHHEFATVPHVREDMTSLLLNLKLVRFKFVDEGEEQARLRLEVKGEGIVTAGDIVCPPTVDVVNPEQYLLTTDSPEADLEMEMTVSRGRGYSPAEERGKLPVAEIPTDAVFSPVRKINYKVERARIGQSSNFDRLSFEIWTDGTVSPSEALSTGAQILARHMAIIAEFGDVTLEVEPEAEESKIPERIAEANIEDLDLSVRAFNCLKRAGITKVGEIIEKLERDEEELLAIRNFGQKSLDELKDNLRQKGYWPLPPE